MMWILLLACASKTTLDSADADNTVGVDPAGSDGGSDEECLQYADEDGDGFGDPDRPVPACEELEGFVEDDSDCDDTDPLAGGGRAEVPYDGSDNDCAPSTPDDDIDGDGLLYADDCDDSDPLIGAREREVPYDGVDNDCDPVTRDDDLDGDGRVLADDCNDADPEAWDPDLHTIIYTEPVLYDGRSTTDFCAGACAVEVERGLHLEFLPNEDLSDLHCLTSVSGGLEIYNSNNLESLRGLERLAYLHDGLRLKYNYNLASLRGLDSLDALGNFTIVRNTQLVDLSGLEHIHSADIILQDLTGLVSLSGIGNLTRFGLTIADCPQLTDLTGIGFPDYASIIYITGNDELLSLEGLEPVQGVGQLTIDRNDRLVDLRGLENLETVNGLLTIAYNDVLDDLSHLHGLEAARSDIRVIHNLLLTEEDAYALCDSVELFLGHCSYER